MSIGEVQALNKQLTTQLAMTIVFTILGLLFLSYFAWYELKQASKNVRQYFTEAWNYIDFTLIFLYLVHSAVSFSSLDTMYLQILDCVLVILVFMKVCYYLRIYDGFSFLVSMMQGVFLDIKYFITFYALVIVLFSSLFGILGI